MTTTIFIAQRDGLIIGASVSLQDTLCLIDPTAQATRLLPGVDVFEVTTGTGDTKTVIGRITSVELQECPPYVRARKPPQDTHNGHN